MTQMQDNTYWVMDTETTGMPASAGHKLIEIGAIELIGRKLTGRYFHIYLDPEREIDAGATRVHGITLGMLKGKPVFKDVAKDIMSVFEGTTLIAHNAPFDMSFMDAEFEAAGVKGGLTPRCKVIDTLKMAKHSYPGQRNSLDALCKRLNVDNSGRDLHGALLDCEILIDVYLAMTGGQKSLIEDSLSYAQQAQQNDEEKATEAKVFSGHEITSSNLKPVLAICEKLRVIKASPDELAAHEKACEKFGVSVF